MTTCNTKEYVARFSHMFSFKSFSLRMLMLMTHSLKHGMHKP